MNSVFRKMDCSVIRGKLLELTNFLNSYKPIADLHIVDFYTKNMWTNVVPACMQNEVEKSSLTEVQEIFSKIIVNKNVECETNLKNIKQFFLNCNELSVRCDKTCTIDINDLYEHFHEFGCNKVIAPVIRDFMSPKKIHEVENMSRFVSYLADYNSASHVIDVGQGKGYLTSVLAMHNKLKVLGVDSSEVTSCSAIKRVKKITKHSGSLIKDTNLDMSDFVYKQITCYMTENTNLINKMERVFDEKVSKVELVGLHTCGNLAATCLKSYVREPKLTCLINIGCCYHLIDEEFTKNPFWNEIDNVLSCDSFGFPMSEYLNSQKFYLGRNARMIAAHNLDRFSENYLDSLRSINYRCLLQVLLEKYQGQTYKEGQVGKIAVKFLNFFDYLKKVEKKFNIQFSESDHSVIEEYENQFYLLEIYYLLRQALTQVIESIILLDRLLYLHEQGFQNSYLTRLFDPAKSPRCYSIVSWKS